jgi:O-acetyl-ADP-ribose deacetylase (regulator of RNase III)
MTQEERRIWLIKALQKEMPEYASYAIPADAEGQWYLLRALFNVRMPAPVSAEFAAVEGAFLEEMTREKGIVEPETIAPMAKDPRLAILQGDITRLHVDAIVNAANSQMLGCFRPNHNCIDNIEQTMAGAEMRWELYQIMQKQGHEEPTGQAKITKGYHLPARYVLHTVGPIVQGSLTEQHKKLLASCYTSCLELADQYRLQTIAFCCISTGVFSFPQEEAAQIAIRTVRQWLDQHPDSSLKRVIFDVFKNSDLKIYQKFSY